MRVTARRPSRAALAAAILGAAAFACGILTAGVQPRIPTGPIVASVEPSAPLGVGIRGALRSPQRIGDRLPDDVAVPVVPTSTRRVITAQSLRDGLNETLQLYVGRSRTDTTLCLIAVTVSVSLTMTCLPERVLLENRVDFALGRSADPRRIAVVSGEVRLVE